MIGPDDKRYVSNNQEAFNGLLKSYKAYMENEYLAVSNIALAVLNI